MPFRTGKNRAPRLYGPTDHIQELRAELRGCHFSKRERAAVEAELAKALAEQAEIERNFDRAMESYRQAEAIRC